MDNQFRGLLKDFDKVGDVEKTIIEKYKGIVSNEIIELWKDYGYGSFYNGFFKIINPDKFMNLYGLLIVNTTEYLPYEEAISKYGKLEYEQCFGYTPLLSLGGYEHVDSLEKVDLMTHLEVIAQLQEPYVWDCLK